MLEFERKNNRVLVKGIELSISPLREIWEKDRSRIKEKATAVLTYVHLASQLDPSAPYFQAHHNEVRQLVAKNIWRDNVPKDIEKYDIAIEGYQKAYERPEVRMIKAYNKKIDQMQDMLDSTMPKIQENFNDKTGAVTYASNLSIINKALLDLNSLFEAKDVLEQRVKKENAAGINTGQRKPSKLERAQMNG